MRKRRKVLIFLLVILCLAVFVYARRERLFQQAKNLIKQNLEKSFPCELSIGRIRAGLFYGLVLENLKISFPQVLDVDIDIKVDQAWADYNLWQYVFSGSDNRQKDIRTLRLISPDFNISYPAQRRTQGVILSSVAQETELPKFVSLGDFAFVLEDGRISLQNMPPIVKDLQGRVILSQEGLYFQDIKGTIKDNLPNILKFYGELTEKRLSLTANLDHVKFGNFDLLTNLTLSLDKRIEPVDQAAKIYGTFKTYGSVLDNRPFSELSSAFEIQDKKLRILSLTFGDNYDLRGVVDLSAPFSADLSLNLFQAAPHELISQFTFPEQPDFSGLVNGLIKITGELRQPKIEGYLEARDGHLSDFSFVSADINIRGRYPRISIADSRICREEDSFIMEGEIDFTDLERQDYLELRIEPDSGLFWQGWDIARRQEDRVHMSKSIADDVKVTFDTFMQDEGIDYEDSYTNELGLEYRIFGEQLLKLRLRKEEEILGVERRIRF